jgi:putative ABC transport system permease protein
MFVRSFRLQLQAVFALFLREWPHTLASLVVPVVGAAGTTFILVSLFGISNGISDAMERGGEDDAAIVLDRDAQLETSSHLSDADVTAIIDALNVDALNAIPLHDDEHALVISPELVQTVDTLSRGGEAGAQVLARGIGASGIERRKNFRIVEGRPFIPGKLEVIVGRQLSRDIAGLSLGTTLTGSTHEWSIVGVFEDGGGTGESEVWMDLETARTESGARMPISSLRVQPLTQAQLGAFRDAVRGSPQLQVQVEPEREHQARQFSQAIERVRLFAVGLALLLGIGAMVASINTMSAVIVTRERAVATLHALGFPSSVTVTALFAETMLLGLIGGALGAGVAFLVADGYGLSVLNGTTGTPFALSASVTTASLMQGVSLAALLTAIAAIVPCVSQGCRKKRLM